MKIKVIDNRAGDVERNIAPPMALASSLPIQVEHGTHCPEGLTLYIAASQFVSRQPPRQLIADVAREIARRINAAEGRKS